MSKLRFNWLNITLISVLLVFSITEIAFIRSVDFTADEGIHSLYGFKILKGDPAKRSLTTDDSKMPVSALNAIPRAIEQVLNPGLKKYDNGAGDIQRGRYITFLVSLFTLFLVFRWSSDLNKSRWAGVLSMALLAFCPNWLAHSGLVTTDVYAGTIFLLVFYSLWKYFVTGKNKYFILFCILVGLAQLVKQTFTYLYFCIPLLFLIRAWTGNRKITLKKTVIQTALIAIFSLLIINAGFLFHKTGQPLNEYHFVSKMFSSLQHKLSFIGNVFLPLPEPYLTGMDTVKYFDELGGGFPYGTVPVVSILGHREAGKSYWYYYIVSALFKMPIPVLFFIGLVAVKTFITSRRAGNYEWVLVIPAFIFLIIISFFNNLQMGVRHMIFLFPLVYILCGKIVDMISSSRTSRILFAGSAVWILVSVYSYLNAYISYTNEFILNKTMAFTVVGGTNVGFGNGRTQAEEYIKNNSDAQFATPVPGKGKFLLSAVDYEDGWGMHTYKWLEAYKPIGHVHHAYLIVEVK